MKYTDRFQAALLKTRELTLSVDAIQFDRALSVEEIKSILRVCVDALYQSGYTNSETLAAKCVPVNMIINEHVERILGIKTHLTIGDRYWSDKDIYCEMSYEAISRELKTPDVTQPINAHVWLTLSDGTIIDFTGEAHFDVLQSRGNFPVEQCYQVIRPDDAKENDFHRPFLVGNDFLFKTGSIRLNPELGFGIV